MSNLKKIHLVGNAHLDPVWLWRVGEGQTEVMQTFRSALDRIDEYEKFVFTCSSAAYYKWVENTDPDMFYEIKKAVQAGKWVPVGGMWVQPDCNMPSGESFARHALYSQLYYSNKLGRKCKTGYNVDSFGHNAMMPQLLMKSGMNQYVMMRPNTNENKDMPEGLFWWEGIDGSRVLTYRIPTGYGEHGRAAIDNSMRVAKEMSDKKDHGMMLFYGVGNHGGGPTKSDIEYLSALAAKERDNRIVFSDPDTYFEEMKNTLVDLPVWKSDMQHHASGCYSATSLVKYENRRAENGLYSAELWDAVAAKRFETAASTEKITEAWQKVLFNQFHDILCGCSIAEAYQDARDFYGYANSIAGEVKTSALLKLSKSIDTWIDGVSDTDADFARHNDCGREFLRPVVVFNPLSWDVKVPVRVSQMSGRVYNSDHEPVLFSNVRSSRSNDSHKDTVILAEVPALGYSTYWLGMSDDGGAKAKSHLKAGRSFMENKYMRVEFDKKTGGIIRLVDKASGKDYACGRTLAVPTVVKDDKSDTWAHDVFKFKNEIGPMSLLNMELIEKDGVRAVIRVKYFYEKSYFTCDYILAEDAKTLRVKCRALWQEKFTIVKIPFDIGGKSPVATYEIQNGYIKRTPNGNEEPCQKWADVTCADDNGSLYGLSIINNGRYSYDCDDTKLSLTALRNVIFADHYSDRPPADFKYTDEGLTYFEYGIYLHNGNAEDSDVVKQAVEFNIRPDTILAGYHKGKCPQKDSFIHIDKDNIVVTAFKLAENGCGDIILRLYESKGIKITKASVTSRAFGFAFYSDIAPHEIKTFRIDSFGNVSDVNFLEGIVR